MSNDRTEVLRTRRLRVRLATSSDVELVHALWTDPRVTRFVGFPRGIPTSPEEVREQIERDENRPLRRLLIAETSEDGNAVGQVKLGEPDGSGICEPDIKLFPDHWGQGYGRELWGAMIDHLFAESDCSFVQGTPNIANTASIRMMEGCGMARVRQGLFEPGGPLKDWMTEVPHYVYQITREEWEKGRAS